MLMMAGPATIEKEQVKRNAGPAVLDRPTSENDRVRNPAKERNQEGGEAWEVRIYNDGMNTREHVARALVQITSMTEMTAYQTMMTAHQNGIASVGMFCFEIAEMYNEGLRKQGIVCDIVPVDEENWSELISSINIEVEVEVEVELITSYSSRLFIFSHQERREIMGFAGRDIGKSIHKAFYLPETNLATAQHPPPTRS